VARRRFHRTSALIAGTSRPHDTLSAVWRSLLRAPWLHTGGERLFKTAIASVIVWLLGMFGVYRVGDLAHVFLLVGLMLLLLAVLKAREAARLLPESRKNV